MEKWKFTKTTDGGTIYLAQRRINWSPVYYCSQSSQSHEMSNVKCHEMSNVKIQEMAWNVKSHEMSNVKKYQMSQNITFQEMSNVMKWKMSGNAECCEILIVKCHEVLNVMKCRSSWNVKGCQMANVILWQMSSNVNFFGIFFKLIPFVGIFPKWSNDGHQVVTKLSESQNYDQYLTPKYLGQRYTKPQTFWLSRYHIIKIP